MKRIQIPALKMELIVEKGSGEIVSHLPRETCSFCGQAECCYSCDESTEGKEGEEELVGRFMYNGALDAIESLTLAFAASGVVDVTSNEYVECVQTTLDALGNNL